MRRLTTALLIAFVAVFALSACDMDDSNAQDKEDKSRQNNYEQLVESQPAESMEYSPTRATKNFWITTWEQKGKLSYVYLLNSLGETIGYYVLEGLPVSYCTSLTVPYKIRDDVDGNLALPGPSIDGTFSSASNCNVFYGKDATTGAYIEYTTGQGINALLYDQPIPRFADAEPLGLTQTQNVE